MGAACMQLHHLGYYGKEEDAARAYDIAVRKHRGKHAFTNLPPRPGRPPTQIKPPVSPGDPPDCWQLHVGPQLSGGV